MAGYGMGQGLLGWGKGRAWLSRSGSAAKMLDLGDGSHGNHNLLSSARFPEFIMGVIRTLSAANDKKQINKQTEKHKPNSKELKNKGKGQSEKRKGGEKEKLEGHGLSSKEP